MKLRSLALALTLGLLVGVGPILAQEATPEATAQARGKAAIATTADSNTGALLDFLRYVPNDASYRQYVTYGDKAAWLKSWNVPNAQSIDELNTLDDLARKRWMFILTRQTLVPSALGIEYLVADDGLKYYGFNYFAADRYLEAGQPPNLITAVDGQFNTTRIDVALKSDGYTTTALKPSGTLYSLNDDYAINLTGDVPRMGQLGQRNRIALMGQRMLIARATETIQNAVSVGAANMSLADAPEYQAVVDALNDPQMADVGPLMGALIMDSSAMPTDPLSLMGGRGTPEQIKKIQEALNLQPKLTPYVLSAFTTHHNNGKTYLVLALVFSSGSDAQTAAKNLGDRIQNYTSIMTNAPFLDAIHAKFERSLAVQANGLPVAMVVLSADDPGPDSTVVPDWTRAVFSRDLGFLYINSN
jgi:hypothetical protein